MTGRSPLAIAALLAACATSIAPAVRAQDCDELLRARFVESAPRDRFELEAGAGLDGELEALSVELAGAAGGLMFDTEEGGDGVEVFQPFRAERASDGVRIEPVGFAGDGATRIDIALEGVGAGARFGFSIDVDDTLVESSLGRIRVDGAEIEGATIALQWVDATGAPGSATGTFDDSAEAIVCR